MTIPAEALARVDARLRSLRPGEKAKLEVTLDAIKTLDGTLRVVAYIHPPKATGERYTLVLPPSEEGS